MLKILQARLQQYVNLELPGVQAGFRKGRGTSDQIANIQWIIEKNRRIPEKTSASLTLLKLLTVWITTNCGKFLKRWEYQTTFLASRETYMQVKKQQKQAWNNRLVQNGERSMSRLHIITLLFNLYAEYIMWNAGLDEAQTGIKIARKNTSHLRYADDATLMAESKEELKRLFDKRWKKTALKQVYYQGWNRSPARVGCMRQVLRAGALGRPRGMGWRGRRERGSGWGIHVNPWLIHVNV